MPRLGYKGLWVKENLAHPPLDILKSNLHL